MNDIKHDLILTAVLQMGNTHPELIQHAADTMRENMLTDRAKREGVEIIGDERWSSIEFGNMEPTGEFLDELDDDGNQIPVLVWETCPGPMAKEVRITWEARARRL